MNEKFKIVKETKLFISDLNNFIINVPRKDYIIRNKLYDTSLDLLYKIYLANNTKDNNIKLSIQTEIISQISLIDYYIEHSYTNKYITEKQCLKKINHLNKIRNMIYGWINASKSS